MTHSDRPETHYLVAAERLDADEFNAALQRAWEQRSQWETIGQKASAEIQSIYTCGFFADQLEAVQQEIIQAFTIRAFSATASRIVPQAQAGW